MTTAAGPIKGIRCPCGFEVRSRSESELIELARIHVQNAHGELVSDEQARALIQVV